MILFYGNDCYNVDLVLNLGQFCLNIYRINCPLSYFLFLFVHFI